MNFDTLGGRRFVVVLISILAVNIQQWFGKLELSGSAYSTVMTLLIGAYISGNVWQRHIESKGTQP